jgi:hypothetical protein
VTAGQVVPDDAKVVTGDVGELRTSRALANGPRVGRGGLEAIIHTYVAAVGQCGLALVPRKWLESSAASEGQEFVVMRCCQEARNGHRASACFVWPAANTDA